MDTSKLSKSEKETILLDLHKWVKDKVESGRTKEVPEAERQNLFVELATEIYGDWPNGSETEKSRDNSLTRDGSGVLNAVRTFLDDKVNADFAGKKL